MNSDNGWILPDGTYLECTYREHAILKNDPSKKTAIQVVWIPPLPYLQFKGAREPNFYIDKSLQPTSAQITTIRKYCNHFKCEFHLPIPTDY